MSFYTSISADRRRKREREERERELFWIVATLTDRRLLKSVSAFGGLLYVYWRENFH